MQTSVILSIKPEFAFQIFEGVKKYEFRRKIFSNKDVKRVYVYVTAPSSCIVGEFEIEDILTLEPTALWERTAAHSGISKEFFDKYFLDQKIGYAIKIGKTTIYDEPLGLQKDFNIKHAPQFFLYLYRIPVLDSLRPATIG